MRNKEFQKLLKKKQSKSNSGFTLTELLVGLFMSIFVIGALGFGLMSILRVTQKGNSETLVRNESSRALDFISDEMRRASAIEVDMTDTNINAVSKNYKNKKKAGATVRLALQIPGINHTVGSTVNPERIIYSVATPENTSPWKGPLVIYRWGPNLDANGNYTDPTNSENWKNEALVDGISDVAQTVACDNNGDGIDETITYKGFFACVVDDDGDGTSGEPEDNDGKSITAQLYFTGGTKTVDGFNSTYSADTKAIARVRPAPSNNSDSFKEYITSYKSLGAVYGCKPVSGAAGINWQMRTDFINNPNDPDSEVGNQNRKWVHDDDRQPQPIKINTASNLTINSIPVNESGSAVGCISKGGSQVSGGNYTNESITGKNDPVYYKNGSQYVDKNDNPVSNPVFKETIHMVSHTIDFDDPATFNGYTGGNNDVSVKDSETGNNPTDADATVLFLRPNDLVPDDPGYDSDDNSATTADGQQTLREFLNSKGYLKADNTVDPAKLGKNERIVIFELGHTDTSQPGFDRQDNIFILSSDIFAKDAP